MPSVHLTGATLRMINVVTVSSTSPVSLTFITQPHGNPVIEWNDRTLAAIAQNLDDNPPRASRVLALESIAVHDTLSAINDKPGYLVDLDAPAEISGDAAIAGAAERILSYAFPGQSNVFR